LSESLLSRFQELVYSKSADLVWVTETWLTKDIYNAEILPTGYSIYRKDRKMRNGGGVLLAIKSDDLEVTSVEIITHSKLKLLICCCYRPPNAEKIWLDKFNSILADLSSRYDNIIICGDFNFPKVNWQSPVETFGADEISFTEQLNDFYLTQFNTLAIQEVSI
jgi:exonuclease III